MDQIVDRPFIVVGDLMLDRYQYCDAADIAADGPMMSLVPLERRDYLGGAAMIARHLAGLGAEPTLLASLGTDDASDAAMDDLEAAGVHVLAIRNRKRIATRTRFVVDTQKLFTLEECPVIPTDSGNERYVLEQVKKLGGEASSLVMYDAGLGLLTDSLALAVLEVAHVGEKNEAYGRLCGGTAGSRGRLSRMRGADLLVASERAIRMAMRDHEQGISALAYRTLNELKSSALFTPLGKKGLLAFDQSAPGAAGEAWEGKLRSEYLAEPGEWVDRPAGVGGGDAGDRGGDAGRRGECAPGGVCGVVGGHDRGPADGASAIGWSCVAAGARSAAGVAGIAALSGIRIGPNSGVLAFRGRTRLFSPFFSAFGRQCDSRVAPRKPFPGAVSCILRSASHPVCLTRARF